MILQTARVSDFHPSDLRLCFLSAVQYFVLTVSSLAAYTMSVPLTSRPPKAAVVPSSKIRLGPKVLFVQQNEKHCVAVGEGVGGYKRTGQIMLALHALVRKSRYQTPLPTYCNWGDCEALSQGQDDCGGRKAVLCTELNGDGALHSYRASTEDRVIQPNEVLQHTSSPVRDLTFSPRPKRITALTAVRGVQSLKEPDKKVTVSEWRSEGSAESDQTTLSWERGDWCATLRFSL